MRISNSKLDSIDDTRRLQLLIDAIVDYAIYMIDLDGTVRSWNSGAQRLKGYTPQEIIEKSFASFYTPQGPGQRSTAARFECGIREKVASALRDGGSVRMEAASGLLSL